MRRGFVARCAIVSFCRCPDTRRCGHWKGIWSGITGIPSGLHRMQQAKPLRSARFERRGARGARARMGSWASLSETLGFLAERQCFVGRAYPSRRCLITWKVERPWKTFWRGFLPFRAKRRWPPSKKPKSCCWHAPKRASSSTNGWMSDLATPCLDTTVKPCDTPASLDSRMGNS